MPEPITTDLAVLAQRYLDGATVAELAAEARVSESTMRRRLLAHGIELRASGESRKRTGRSGRGVAHPLLADETWMRGEYTGKSRSLSSLADELGCSVTAVHRALRRLAIQAHPEGQTSHGVVSLTCADVDCGQTFTRRASRLKARPTVEVFCSAECRTRTINKRRFVGRYVNGDGYVMVVVPEGTPGRYADGYMPEHRYVMQQQVGRPLFRDEQPHHVNGDRADNRPTNLELWSSAQPAGQRVADKVDFAVEMLMRYRPDLLR